jgi:hypothetical protein
MKNPFEQYPDNEEFEFMWEQLLAIIWGWADPVELE